MDKRLMPIVCIHPGTFECFMGQFIHYVFFWPISLVLGIFGYDLTAYISPHEE